MQIIIMGCACLFCEEKIGPIIDRFETLYDGQYKKIINFEKVKKGELYVNLIHYDKNLRNNENIKYYRYFSVNVKGSYYSIDDFDILKLTLSKIKEIPFPSCYILLMTGSESEEILKEFNYLDFLDEFIIFCRNKKEYNDKKEKYKKINLVTNEFKKIIEYLKTKKYPKEDLNMDNHLFQTPLITYYEYKKCLYPIHKVLSYFFNLNERNFTEYHFKKAIEFINHSFLEQKDKEQIINIMKKLSEYSYFNFPKACIKYYT